MTEQYQIRQKGLHFLLGQSDESGEWEVVAGPYENNPDILDQAYLDAKKSELYSQLVYVCGKE